MSCDILPVPAPILSPCVGVCRLDDRGLCEGCQRTVDEITHWRTMSAAERQRLMDVVLPARVSAPDG